MHSLLKQERLDRHWSRAQVEVRNLELLESMGLPLSPPRVGDLLWPNLYPYAVHGQTGASPIPTIYGLGMVVFLTGGRPYELRNIAIIAEIC